MEELKKFPTDFSAIGRDVADTDKVPVSKNETGEMVAVPVSEITKKSVKLAGDQTIADVITFTKPPVVPAPTADMHPTTRKFVEDKELKKAQTWSEAEKLQARKNIGAFDAESAFVKLGLQNPTAFFVTDLAKQAASAIMNISIEVDDTVAVLADIRMYGMFCGAANPTSTLVVKDFTTGTLCQLNRPLGVNIGIVTLSGSSSDSKIKVVATLNLDKLIYANDFIYYQNNNTASAKLLFTKFSDVLQKKAITDAESLARSNADTSLSDRINAIIGTAMSYQDVAGVAESVNGYYKSWETGFAASSLYMSKKFPVTQGKSYYASSRVSGSAVALAVYMNGSTFISAQFVGVNTGGYVQYTRQLLTLPATATHVGITSFGTSVYYGNLEEIVFDAISPNELATVLLGYSPNSHLGEKALLVGTSIPWQGVETGDSYPQLLANSLGITMYNEAVGSSCVRAGGNNTGTTKFGLFKGLHCAVLLKALSHTIAEKQQIMDKWQSGLDLNGNIFVGGTFGYRDFQLDYLADWATLFTSAEILGFSYQNKIINKYLDSTSPTFIAKPKYLIIDHGHNDLVQTTYDISEATAIAIPSTRNDRTTFIGAMNYIIDEVLKSDARQEILFIGHYENDRKTRIYKGQQNLFAYWNFPSFKTWEYLGWSQQIVQTTGYWSAGVWIPSGGALQSLTTTQIWMYDDLHPATLAARQHYASKLIGWFKTL